ncbi:hypothetical protein V1477_018438 [Vespula maculifrons]|uniref:Uncharacterized protein n=1 Tax=Vespula maculifrons TaxID=7453 RepID=A0ABD2AVD5_VESMC
MCYGPTIPTQLRYTCHIDINIVANVTLFPRLLIRKNVVKKISVIIFCEMPNNLYAVQNYNILTEHNCLLILSNDRAVPLKLPVPYTYLCLLHTWRLAITFILKEKIAKTFSQYKKVTNLKFLRLQ